MKIPNHLLLLSIILSLVSLAACQQLSPAPGIKNVTENSSLPAQSISLADNKSISGISENRGKPIIEYSVVDANNQLALDLYSEFRREKGNIFFSPYSISNALAMCYEGARGETANEIQAVSHFPVHAGSRRTGFAEINDNLTKTNRNYELYLANALWVQEGYPIINEYSDILDQYYAAKTANVNFISAPSQASDTINSWVAQKTRNKIQDLVRPESIDERTRFILTNAIYFKGDWVYKFETSATRPDNFKVTPSSTVTVPFMRGKASHRYAQTEDAQILEMDYKGDRFSMMLLLPTKNDLASLEKQLSLEKLGQWKEKLVKREVGVMIPKFSFTETYPLSDTLQRLGMPTAFIYPKADFSGIDGTKYLYIQDVRHKAYIEVNEEGTIAAAATKVQGGKGGGPPVFWADRPFLFLIQDKTNGNILFMGRVSDPRQ